MRKRSVAVAAIYTAVALAATWPLARVIDREIAWDMGDPLFNSWVIQWTGGQVLRFLSGDLAALKSFLEASGGEALLVLPASGDAEEFKEWALAFADFGVRRAIITKFDATKRVGAALTAAHAGGMSLAHFSESPFISEGLLSASPEYLARRLLASRPGRLG